MSNRMPHFLVSFTEICAWSCVVAAPDQSIARGIVETHVLDLGPSTDTGYTINSGTHEDWTAERRDDLVPTLAPQQRQRLTTNAERARRVGVAINAYLRHSGDRDSIADDLVDILSDLRHYADTQGVSYHACDAKADDLYGDEIADESAGAA